jgi:outer membrane receptor for ferric coprogen and ferric-rhodotorulic acid
MLTTKPVYPMLRRIHASTCAAVLLSALPFSVAAEDTLSTTTDNDKTTSVSEGHTPHTLPTVNVQHVAPVTTVTEGSRSYTSPALTIGSKTAQSLRETPQSVSVITQQRLEEQTLTTLDAALAQSTGITVNPSHNRAGALFARGFLVSTVQLDGVSVALPTNNYGYDSPDLAIYDHVEVLRGSAGLLNGAGTPGAVIGLSRKRPTAEKQFKVNATYGSWNNKRIELDGSTPLNADGSLRARGVITQENRDFFYDVAKQNKTLVYGVVDYDLSPRTRFTVGASHQDITGVPLNGTNLPRYSNGGDLKLPRSTFLGASWNREQVRHTDVFAEMEHQFNDRWKFKLAATQAMSTTDAKIGFLLGAIDPATGTGAFQRGNAVQAEVQRKGLDAFLSGSFDAFGRQHEIVLGANRSEHRYQTDIMNLYTAPYTPVDIFSYDPHAVPEPATPTQSNGINDQHTTQTGVYGTVRFKLTDDATLILGARHSHWKFKQQNLKTGVVNSNYSDTAVTPFAGLVYALNNNWSLYGSYADVFQVQNSFKFDGSQLPPVTGVNYEAGIKGELLDGKLTTSLAVFQIERKNIAERDTVNTSPTACNGFACYVTGGETQSRGIEAEINGALTPHWQLFAGYTFNTTKYVRNRTITGAPSDSEGQPLAEWVPKHIFRVWTNYQLPGQWQRWHVGGGINAQTSFYRVLSGQRLQQGAYALWNARVGYQIDKTWSVAVSMNNLFDKSYYARFNLLDQGTMYGEPRNFTVALRGNF